MRAAGISPTVIPIRIHLQRFFWHALSDLLKAAATIGYLGRYLRFLTLLLLPFRLLANFVFAILLVNMYKAYLIAKKHCARIWRPAKNRLLFPLSTRYVLHGILIVTTVFVATNSLRAREIRQSELSKPSVLATLLRAQDDTEIVETSEGIITRVPHRRYGIGGVSPLDIGGPIEDADIAAVQDASSLVKPDLTGTDIGDRPREDVIFHTVEPGETVSTIAELYTISTSTILWENRLGERDFIKPGQKLTVLPTTGVSHRVNSGDTVAAIAKKYKAAEEDILAFNKLASADTIREGQVLIVPNGEAPPPPPAPTPTTRLAVATGVVNSGPAPANTIVAGSGLLWPTPGRKINQYFNGWHGGIDIDGEYSSPIYASQSGRVQSSGWNGGYGLRVVIDHGNGTQTLYGHASKLFVKVGQYVERGQTVAMQGSTGRSTGVHLHFEIYIGGRRVNPLSYVR